MTDLQINNIELLISHPGEVLKCELDERGMSQKELADVIGKATPVINDIIKGKRDINVEIAVLLEAVFENIKAETWLNLQNQYDLQKIRNQEMIQRLQSSITAWNSLKTSNPTARHTPSIRCRIPIRKPRISTGWRCG